MVHSLGSSVLCQRWRSSHCWASQARSSGSFMDLRRWVRTGGVKSWSRKALCQSGEMCLRGFLLLPSKEALVEASEKDLCQRPQIKRSRNNGTGARKTSMWRVLTVTLPRDCSAPPVYHGSGGVESFHPWDFSGKAFVTLMIRLGKSHRILTRTQTYIEK